MISLGRTAAVGAAAALTAGIALSGLGVSAAGAATYPPVTPTPTPTNPGTFKCTATAVNRKDNIKVTLTATGASANYKDYVFKIQKYLPGQQAWKVNNIVYQIKAGKQNARIVDREAGRYRAKCFGPTNLANYTQKVRLTR